MCGIIGYFNLDKNKVNKEVITQYSKQASRGKEGYGMLFIKQDKTFNLERGILESEMIHNMYKQKNQVPMMLFHHRKPTSTENLYDQTHPIFVSNLLYKHDYYVLHNGMIHNAEDRYKDHNTEGLLYTTLHKGKDKKWIFNDSESLAIDLVRYIELGEKIQSKGGAAYIIAQINKKTKIVDKIFYGTNRKSLNIAKSREIIRISSEGPGNEVKEDFLYNFNTKDFKIHKRKLLIPTYIATTPAGTYSGNHSIGFTAKEREDAKEENDVPLVEDTYAKECYKMVKDKMVEASDRIEEIMEEMENDMQTHPKSPAEIEITTYQKSFADIIYSYYGEICASELEMKEKYEKIEKEEEEEAKKEDNATSFEEKMNEIEKETEEKALEDVEASIKKNKKEITKTHALNNTIMNQISAKTQEMFPDRLQR